MQVNLKGNIPQITFATQAVCFI